MYMHQLPDWPRFHWDIGKVAEPLSAIRYSQGILSVVWRRSAFACGRKRFYRP